MPTPDGVQDLENILSHVWPSPNRIQISSGLRRRSPGQTFGLLPHLRRPTLLIPTAPRRVAARALRGYKSPTTRGDRLRAHVFGWAALAGAGHLFPWTVTISGPVGAPSLLCHIESHVGEPLHMALAIGPPRANRKPVLQLMTPHGAPVAFVKVGVNPLTRDRVQAEGRALQHLNRLIIPGLKVPGVLSVPPWQDTPFLTTLPLDTWTSGPVNPETQRKGLQSLVSAAEVTTVELRTSQWWRALTERLWTLENTPEAMSLRKAGHSLESHIGQMSLPQGQTHGDWSPWNIATQGPQVSAWDWERFMPQAPIGYDSLHYAVQEEIRLRAKPPREALARVLDRASLVVAQNGADPHLGTALFALYLLAQGEQHLTDRQLDAGSERGPISEWLIPSLQIATAQLERSAR